MGPLIPHEILSPEWNNVIAVFIGLAFGFIMEASGFSSSRKLVGVFYGYDFAVLRVFFTAAIVSMIGILYLSKLGYLNFDDLYVQPTYLRSAIIGSVIMGLGFVTGGFCPGTSLCAAGIGKLDGLVFIIGLMIGVVIFSEMFPLLEKTFNADNLGGVTLKDTFGISYEMTTVLFTVIGVIAFYVTTIIGRKIRNVWY
ncbi:MAG TPA: sulfurtransferase [Saprospiraceae bacterium]|nr:sulfurtransferase [Saprospiraceae bacterium]